MALQESGSKVSLEKVKDLFKFRIEDYQIFISDLKTDDPQYEARKELYEHSIREYKLLPYLLEDYLKKEGEL